MFDGHRGRAAADKQLGSASIWLHILHRCLHKVQPPPRNPTIATKYPANHGITLYVSTWLAIQNWTYRLSILLWSQP
jgi:hypothetical protein